jgi:hypothetical protein
MARLGAFLKKLAMVVVQKSATLFCHSGHLTTLGWVGLAWSLSKVLQFHDSSF